MTVNISVWKVAAYSSSNGQLIKTSFADASTAIPAYFDLASADLTAFSMRCSETEPFLVAAGARTKRPVAALRPRTAAFDRFEETELGFVAILQM